MNLFLIINYCCIIISKKWKDRICANTNLSLQLRLVMEYFDTEDQTEAVNVAVAAAAVVAVAAAAAVESDDAKTADFEQTPDQLPADCS